MRIKLIKYECNLVLHKEILDAKKIIATLQ